MKTHPTTIRVSQDLDVEELAHDLSQLRYDALSDFLGHLAKCIDRDGDKDTADGKPKLGELLDSAACEIQSAAVSIRRAWHICKPHMAGE